MNKRMHGVVTAQDSFRHDHEGHYATYSKMQIESYLHREVWFEALFALTYSQKYDKERLIDTSEGSEYHSNREKPNFFYLSQKPGRRSGSVTAS